MSERSTTFAMFTVERSVRAGRARVFHAFADLEAKQRWFGDPAAPSPEHTLDFRVGGREHLAGDASEAGGSYTFDAEFRDIVPDERIVYAYDMTIGGRRISVSVATIDLTEADGRTTLRVTEQGVFLDGLDTSEQREHGTNELIDALVASVEETAGVAR
jgi:uncharacterized protein YndB with AHSA1/START domain